MQKHRKHFSFKML